MKKVSPVSEFCNSRGIKGNIKIAFSAYIKGVCADKYLLRSDTDTLAILVGRLTQDQVAKYWLEFVVEFKRLIE